MADSSSAPNSLPQMREALDRLDREFIELLAKRMRLVSDVAALKRQQPDVPLRDEGRERQIFEVWAQEARSHGLSPYFVGRLLRELLNYSRRDQERHLDRAEATSQAALRVGYQGAPGSYSDLAVGKLFAARSVDRLERVGFDTFREAVEAVESGRVEYSLLPIENTIVGGIYEVYDLLADRSLSLVGEEVWPVEHCLVGLPGTRPEALRVIRSHPVALQQCERFLRSLVGVRQESWFDTAGAAQAVAEAGDPGLAAISSEEAAHAWNLQILRRDVADHRRNLTRFLLIGRKAEEPDPRQPAKTSLLLVVAHQHGALARCLRVFDSHGINLTKLESRPLPETPWAYRFYIDLEGRAQDHKVVEAIAQLKPFSTRLEILGSYTRRAGGFEDAPVPAPPLAVEDEEESTSVARRVVSVGDVVLGGGAFGLCVGAARGARRRELARLASVARECGALGLVAGPMSGEGSLVQQLELVQEVTHAYELLSVVAVDRAEDVPSIAAQANVLRIPGHQMASVALLEAVGRSGRAALLERGPSATVEDLLAAAAVFEATGNHQLILVESGIRTFETATRSTVDVGAVAVLRQRCDLPVWVAPGAAGEAALIEPLALAAAAAGADGLLLEWASEESPEALDPEQPSPFERQLPVIAARLAPVLAALGKT
ncbi:MAG: prephenate dehydratase [Acidobacteriota bacterium]